MQNSDEVKNSFIKAALAGKWANDTISINEPYVLYITPNEVTFKSFINELFDDIETTAPTLSIDRYTANTLSVKNENGKFTIITIAYAHGRLYGLRSHTNKRPSVLLGTDLVHSETEQELLFSQFLPALTPGKKIIDLGEWYDSRIN